MNPLKVNTPAPLFNIKDVNGISIRLSDFKGKYILLDFWATWCPPCMREIPFFKKIRNDYPAERLAVIGINNDRDITVCKEAIEKNAMNWIHIFDEEDIIQNLFGVQAYPTTILINKEGVVIYHSGEKDDKKQLISLLENM